MQVIETPREMQAWSERNRRAGQRIGFVPTMGYLHEGHLALVREARRRAERCVVSIYVNPLQFGAGEDLDRYPRDLERDSRLLREAGVHVLYLPTTAVMYPPGFQTAVTVSEVPQGLCGRSRPTHFGGVSTVVTKLFNTVKPHVAVFGEKDFQQLATIRRLVLDLDLDVEIVGVPTVREPDGLARSSRNSYLSPAERTAALCVPRSLAAARQLVRGGQRDAAAVRTAVEAVLKSEPLARIDYVEVVHAETMKPLAELSGDALVAVAVWIGKTRLIDNWRAVPDASGDSIRQLEAAPQRRTGARSDDDALSRTE